ncbi:hypothetical protein IV203_027096 [Nitzschia inconspicua]|uniref:Uncharacterized protein n=1 Tax=Nitzschia inconspicua TaxID=303405 RepID=A0A9K3LL10_9STRA|nr:hypothetical protein IV203_027096 [Nitzschia inconspicua]
MNSLLSPSTLLSWEPNFSYSFFFDHICNAVNNNDQDDQHNIKNALPRITYSHTPQQLPVEDNDNNDEQRDAPPSRPCSNPKETIRSSGSYNPTSTSPKSNPTSTSPKSSSSRRRRRSNTTTTPKMPRIETVLSVTDFIRMDHDESSLDWKSEWNNPSKKHHSTYYTAGHSTNSPTESLSSLDTAVTEATTVSTSSSCGSNDNTSSTTTTTTTIPTSILKKSKYTTTAGTRNNDQNKDDDDDDDTRDVRPATTTTIPPPPKRKHNKLAASVVGHLLFSHSNNNNNNKSIRFAQTVKPAAPTAMYTRTLPTRRQKKKVKVVSASSSSPKGGDAEQTALIVAYLQQEGIVTVPVCDDGLVLSSLYASTKTPLITLPA